MRLRLRTPQPQPQPKHSTSTPLSNEDQHNNTDGNKPEKRKGSHEDFPLQEYRLVPVEEWDERQAEENEIDLVEQAKHIWDRRWFIAKVTGVFIVIGLVVALLSPKEYQSSATLMPEYASEGSVGGNASRLLQQYGGLLGIGGGSYAGNSNAIRVELYPNIVHSLTFQKELMEEEFYFSEYDTTTTIYTFFNEIYTPSVFSYVIGYTIGLPGIIKNWLFPAQDSQATKTETAEEILYLSEYEMQVIENMRQRVTASLNEESGIISIYSTMPDPVVSARVGNKAVEMLTGYLKEYRTEKVMVDLEFVQEQFEKAKQRFEQAQQNLADFRDSNRNLVTAKAQTEEQRLQAEYDLAFNLYNSLAQQLEQAKLKVQEQTPVFKTLQPVQVPIEDETSGVSILMISLLWGLVISIGWILLSQSLKINQ